MLFIENVFGTILKVSRCTMLTSVEIYFFRRLESGEGACAKVPSANNTKIKTKYFLRRFNPFLL